jgi:hypothetical protein
MWMPTPLYEALPYAAMLGGAVATLNATNELLFLSGFLLAASGAIIWKLRKDVRGRVKSPADIRRSY